MSTYQIIATIGMSYVGLWPHQNGNFIRAVIAYFCGVLVMIQ